MKKNKLQVTITFQYKGKVKSMNLDLSDDEEELYSFFHHGEGFGYLDREACRFMGVEKPLL